MRFYDYFESLCFSPWEHSNSQDLGGRLLLLKKRQTVEAWNSAISFFLDRLERGFDDLNFESRTNEDLWTRIILTVFGYLWARVYGRVVIHGWSVLQIFTSHMGIDTLKVLDAWESEKMDFLFDFGDRFPKMQYLLKFSRSCQTLNDFGLLVECEMKTISICDAEKHQN
ncbi:hypothetical protein RCL_jg11733.t1 [Rhizophagus clarus]|uniref:Uncharacterized protein n=1 Tax=Rhizophagus clarus TaxID=94130 RepID=A0A8H3R3L6_9GLOM|nr:hypothetical protein RCL_jg11733.t1 [Rhizophagus clarus]